MQISRDIGRVLENDLASPFDNSSELAGDHG
jgi:hypothetical protein